MKFKKIFIVILSFLLISINSFCLAENVDFKNLNLYSEAAILIDYNTGSILYSKNSDVKMYPASTTKILTAILTLEKCNLDDIVIVSKSAVSSVPAGYSSAYLNPDEQISVADLLTVLLVHSANDAANVLAEHISGSISEFSKLMNEKAQALGCKNTNFVNPSGIHDENHYTTAYDLALIFKYCLSNSTFKQIIGMKNCTIPATNKSDTRKYSNTNELIIPTSKYYIKDCIGGKTGFTSPAKNCLVSACTKNDLTLISVILGASTTELGQSARNVDSTALYEYGYSHYSLKNIASKDTVMHTIEIKNGTKETKNVDLILADDIIALYKSENNDINFEITVQENLSAPIAVGSTIGNVTYNVNGLQYSQNLLASHNVEKSHVFLDFLKILLIIIVLLVLYIYIKKIFKKKAKRNKYFKNN